MAIIKCKMCGGDMELSPDKSFGRCEYCGSTMTLPKVDDEQRAAAFNRGNHFRRLGEFDKALTVYERIVQEDERDAEAHWCCALCRFGIEYVKDPASGEYLPTCHRASFDSFLEDVDYRAALEYADAVARGQYEKDGEKIAQVQRGILSVSQKEKPFDVFLCYKESDENGDRTVDSTLAQDIYYQLTDRGYRVFFARITLEDKAGQAYEPYIFAALHSAKVMIVVGTKPEYLNAVWVKNEWSRYLSIVKKDRTKLLLPCYRDMDPYDMPEQLSVLQSYDMGKIGFVQDLIRGISKVISKDVPKTGHETELSGANEGSGNLTALLKRGYMALEDREWARADEFFEQTLNQDAECGEAYFGKFLAEQKCSSLDSWEKHIIEAKLEQEQIHVCSEEKKSLIQLAEQYCVPGYLSMEEIVGGMDHFDDAYLSIVSPIEKYISQVKELLSVQSDNKLLGRAFRYAKGNLVGPLTAARERILEELDQRLKSALQSAQQNEQRIRGEFETQKAQVLNSAKELYTEASEKKEADEKAEEERRQAAIEKQKEAEKAEERRKEATYQDAVKLQASKKYGQAHAEFERLRDYKDSKDRSHDCLRSEKKRRTIFSSVVSVLILLSIGLIIAYQTVILPEEKYQKAESLLQEGDLDSAETAFMDLGDYKDSADRVLEIRYDEAELLLKQGNLEGAVTIFTELGEYKDSAERISEIRYSEAEQLLEEGDYDGAEAVFAELGNYNDSADRVLEVCYTKAEMLLEQQNYYSAAVAFAQISEYSDARERSLALWDRMAVRHTVSAGYCNTLGLRVDGTVTAKGDNTNGQCNVSDWTDVVSVSSGDYYSIGLKADGTVLAKGNDEDGQCNVSDWMDIVAVSAGSKHTVGLKANGTVIATGENEDGQCDVSDWTDIIDVSCNAKHTVGLKKDGTVVATGNNEYGQCDVSSWTDIVSVSAGFAHTVGLKKDGRVVVTGHNGYGQCNVSNWTDIVAVTAGSFCTIGLRANGTVLAVGFNEDGQCDVSSWSNIDSVSSNFFHTVGLRVDGTAISTGDNMFGQCDVSNWTDMRVNSKAEAY